MIATRRVGRGLLLVAGLAVAAPAAAQLQGPPRDYSGVFGGAQAAPSESRHQFTLDVTALGGYDDDVSGTTTPTPGDPRLAASSTIGEGSAQFAYRYDRGPRYLRLGGNGAATTYSALDYDIQAGGGASIEVASPLGRRGTVRALHQTSYRNYFFIGSFTGLAPALQPDIIPGTTAPFALGKRRAWSSDSSADLTQRWGRSQESQFRGGWHKTFYTDTDIGGLTTLNGSVQHSVFLSRSASVSGTYGYTTADYRRDDGSVRNVASQSLEVGMKTEHRVSPRRRLVVEVGVGGMAIDTLNEATRLPMNDWIASGHASAGIDIGRSWGVRGAYRRGWNYQDGFAEPLLTDSVALSVGGFLGRRVDVVLSGGYANGQVGFTAANGYESYTGSTQVRYALGRNAALFTNYVYYFYRFDDTSLLTVGIPREFDRQSIRVGVSLWVPIAGLFGRSGEQR